MLYDVQPRRQDVIRDDLRTSRSQITLAVCLTELQHFDEAESLLLKAIGR
jgi:hypothetical protein